MNIWIHRRLRARQADEMVHASLRHARSPFPPHFCFSVTLLDSRSVQGELGWVASPTEGGVSALKEVSPCWDAWSPIEQKWRDNIHYWQELGSALPERYTGLFDTILSCWPLYASLCC